MDQLAESRTIQHRLAPTTTIGDSGKGGHTAEDFPPAADACRRAAIRLNSAKVGDLHTPGRGELTPANKPDVQPAFQPFLYTLDLLLPVVSLHVRDAWIAHGAAQVWSVVFIIMGWILATAVVLGLTGLLKRD